MLAGFFRLVVIALIIYVVYVIVRAWQSLSGSRAPRRRPSTGGLMVKDEICNIYVPRDEALRVVRDGREHFFCGEDCRRKFLEGSETRDAVQ